MRDSNQNQYFRKVPLNSRTNRLNNKWEEVLDGKVIYRFEELVRTNEKIYLKDTDRERVYVSLSSDEVRVGGNANDEYLQFLYYGTWKSINEEIRTTTTTSTTTTSNETLSNATGVPYFGEVKKEIVYIKSNSHQGVPNENGSSNPAIAALVSIIGILVVIIFGLLLLFRR